MKLTKEEKIDEAHAEYESIRDPAHAEYKRIIETVEAEWRGLIKQAKIDREYNESNI